MTADPISQIPYPQQSAAADMAATAKVFLDDIGSKLRNPATKGGVYSSSSFSMSANTLTSPALSVTSGTAMVSGGVVVIPADWGGLYGITATWNGLAIPSGARAFIDIATSTQGSFRNSKPTGEDAISVSVGALSLTAGTTIKVSIFCSSSTTSNTVKLVVWRLT